MVNIIVELSKYLMILFMIVYTYQCFTVFGHHSSMKKRGILRTQNVLMFGIHLTAFLVMFLQTMEKKMLYLYVGQAAALATVILLYTKIYPRVSRLIVNNMCMLLSVSFIMLARLSFGLAVKQTVIAFGGVVVSLFVPMLMGRMKHLTSYKKAYGIAGIIALASVLILAPISGGAKLGFEIAGFGMQPSEFVKILFVFFVASSFTESLQFKNIVVTTAIAAFHVLILVVSKDLGAALIIFVVYLVMLYVATRQPLYIVAGLGAGSAASVLAYHLFAHIRTRVHAWQDPFADYANGGYQVAQSLFAIGTGSWFGMGLYQGMADKIPVASTDFIFSAISEEMGLIFALCLILVYLSCYVMFLNIALQLINVFYKLVALGLGTCFIFQAFLTIGGVTKFIPSTGVTLPLVSYGGSSVLSTLLMFAIIQGLYHLREDEEEAIERSKEQQKRTRKKVVRGPKATAEAKAARRPEPERASKAERAAKPVKHRQQSPSYGEETGRIDAEIGATVREALRERKRQGAEQIRTKGDSGRKKNK